MCSKFQHLSHAEFGTARSLLGQYRDVFSVSNDKIRRTDIIHFDLDPTDVRPVAVPLRRVPLHHRHVVTELLEHYSELGLLECLDSPFRASTVLVKKKNAAQSTNVSDQYRLCTDYHMLNKAIPSSGWHAPSLAECLDAAGDSAYFSSVDFNSGYHQIPCTDRAKQMLAFSPGYGYPQFTWTVMPPGVKNASGWFQRAMGKTFVGHERRILPPYYDDIVIKGKSFLDHIQNVKCILDAIRKAGFTLNVLKCDFFQTSVRYLGHVIQDGYICLDPDRVQAIQTFPVPKDVPSLRRFIGMAQFCNRFMPNLNSLLQPLFNLLKVGTAFDWTSHCMHAFTPPLRNC